MSAAAIFAALIALQATTVPMAAQEGRSEIRAERRAYSGAPPAMPHPPLGAACVSCHGAEPIAVDGLGLSPASPHDNAGGMGHCRQCHVAVETTQLFRGSDFAGLRPAVEHGIRAHPLAPPVIPHRIFMRENCLACHGGAAARPEIRTTHADRTHCRQCHLPGVAQSAAASADR